jgi:hypothetical protein
MESVVAVASMDFGANIVKILAAKGAHTHHVNKVMDIAVLAKAGIGEITVT